MQAHCWKVWPVQHINVYVTPGTVTYTSEEQTCPDLIATFEGKLWNRGRPVNSELL